MFGTRDSYPPGPWNFNAAIGLTWRHAVAYWWNPLAFFERMGRYGDMAFFRLFGQLGYLINRPDLICDVLISRRAKFIKWQHQIRPLRRVMGGSILTCEGPQWSSQRQLMQLAFTQNAVDRYQSVAADDAETEIATWESADRVDLAPPLSRLLMRINLKSLFGVSDVSNVRDLMRSIRSLSDVFQAEMFEPFPLSNWLPAKYKRDRRAAIEILNKSFDQILAAKCRTDVTSVGTVLRDATDSAGGPLSHSEQRQIGITMMIAGFHTTSEMLLWVVRLLAEHPDIQQRASEQCRQPTSKLGAKSDDYLDRVIKESLRLYPSAWSLFARQAIDDTSLGNYPIRRGSIIFIAPWVTHRDARYYPDPMQFDPDRFLPENEMCRAKGTYFPFGLGPHVCIGAATATQQVKSIVISLLRRFRFESVESGRQSRLTANLALRYDRGIDVSMTRLSDGCLTRFLPSGHYGDVCSSPNVQAG